MNRPVVRIVLTTAGAMGTILALTWWLNQVGTAARASPAPGRIREAKHCLAPMASDVLTVCLEGTCDYTSIQAAIDVAPDGAVIKVAQGTYTDTHRCAPENLVCLAKTLTIRGGYTITNWTTSYPLTQPTKLDAQRQGRVMLIVGNISPTIEGLWITGGNADGADGGGVLVSGGSVTFSHNVFAANNAKVCGGGLGVVETTCCAHVLLHSNTFISNTAQYGGGGVCFNGLGMSPYIITATLVNNVFAANASGPGGGLGGYVYRIELLSNTFLYNTGSEGGGLYVRSGNDAVLEGNSFISNTASWEGAGLHLSAATATLSNNRIISNTGAMQGGGIYLASVDALLTNNIVIDNQAQVVGSGLYLATGAYLATEPEAVTSTYRLWHTTFARNGGNAGSGLYIAGNHGTVHLTNTIFATHTVGISAMTGNTVTVDGVLWYDNAANISGGGTITVTQALTGNPAFAADGYHLTLDSAAVDQGVETAVIIDIDGELRPIGSAADLGADEFSMIEQRYLPMALSFH